MPPTPTLPQECLLNPAPDPRGLWFGGPSLPRESLPGPALVMGQPSALGPPNSHGLHVGGHRWQGAGGGCRPGRKQRGTGEGQRKEGQPGRVQARARLSAGAPAPGEGGMCSRAGREGQCHLAPGNRRHFLGADRPVVGGAVPTELATRQRGGRGVCGQRRPSQPLCPGCDLRPGAWVGELGASRAGAGMGGAWHAASAAGAFPPPSRRAPLPGRTPERRLCPPTLGPWDPRAIARPP